MAPMLWQGLVWLGAITLFAAVAAWLRPEAVRGIRFIAMIGVGMVLAATTLRVLRAGHPR